MGVAQGNVPVPNFATSRVLRLIRVELAPPASTMPRRARNVAARVVRHVPGTSAMTTPQSRETVFACTRTKKKMGLDP